MQTLEQDNLQEIVAGNERLLFNIWRHGAVIVVL